jgi:hypothetical protein
MKIAELPGTFQDINISIHNSRSVLLPLLQKYDLAITWDNQHLIFPPLLPAQLTLNTIVSRIILRILLIFFSLSQVIVVLRLYPHQV